MCDLFGCEVASLGLPALEGEAPPLSSPMSTSNSWASLATRRRS